MNTTTIAILSALMLSAPLLTACGDEPARAQSPVAPTSPSEPLAMAEPETERQAPRRAERPSTPEPEAAEATVEGDASSEGGSMSDADAANIRRFIVARGIDRREPVNASERFSAEPPIYAFLDSGNRSEENLELLVGFRHENGQRGGFTYLEIPAEAPRWRTWMRSQHVTTPGRWEALVITRDGEVLARESFTVGE
ncbi:MAG: DUF2914 domain-containing protein [Myxococcota bacterium]